MPLYLQSHNCPNTNSDTKIKQKIGEGPARIKKELKQQRDSELEKELKWRGESLWRRRNEKKQNRGRERRVQRKNRKGGGRDRKRERYMVD